jgi:tetratricopeptide (TPR) repeat protein
MSAAETSEQRWREHFEAGCAVVRGLGRSAEAQDELVQARAAFQAAMAEADSFDLEDERLLVTARALEETCGLLGDLEGASTAAMRLTAAYVKLLDLVHAGRAADAIPPLERLVAVRTPNDWLPSTVEPALRTLATAYRAEGRLADAEAVLRRAVSVERGGEILGGAWEELAEVLAEQAKWDEAAAAYRAALTSYRHYLAWVAKLAESGRWKDQPWASLGSHWVADALARGAEQGSALLRSYAACLRKLGRDAETKKMEARATKLEGMAAT